MREHEVLDYFIAVWPEDKPLDDPVTLNHLTHTAIRFVWGQYHHQRPLDIRIEAISWLFTDDADEVERCQPAHECEQCKEGNRKAQAFLREHPGRTLALADLRYVEVWP